MLVTKRTAPLGEIVAAAYEHAASVTSDPERASRIAARAIAQLLSRRGNRRAARKLVEGGRTLRPLVSY
jgi:hypothetical protein